MLKKTWKGHRKEVNLLGPIIPGQIVVFAFCFGVCVCVFPKTHSNALWQVLGPLVLKSLSSDAETKNKRDRSVSIQEFPSPIMPADLDEKAAGSQAHRHLEAQVQPRAPAGLGQGLL